MSLGQTLKTPKILSPQAFLLEELVFVANPNFLEKLTMTTITIQIDPDIAAAFQVSQPEQQQKIQTLINQWMRQALKISTLQNTMDKLSDEAEANGLTPEILQSILDE